MPEVRTALAGSRACITQMHAPAAMCEPPHTWYGYPHPATAIVVVCTNRLGLMVAGWAWWWMGKCCWLTSVVTCHHVVSNVEAQLEVPGTVAQVYLVLQDVHAVVHMLVAAQLGG